MEAGEYDPAVPWTTDELEFWFVGQGIWKLTPDGQGVFNGKITAMTYVEDIKEHCVIVVWDHDPENPATYRKQDFVNGAFKRDTFDDDEGLGDD